MAEAPGEKSEERKRAPAGFEGLLMNEVPSSATQEASEAPRRAGWRWLLLIAILVAVGAVAYGARTLLNVPPGKEAEERLRARLATVPAFQFGTVLEAHYVAGDRLRIDYGRSQGTDPATIRKATIEVMKAFIAERPDRNLYIDGYQGDTEVARAEYRFKGKVKTAAGALEPDITVRVAGEAAGGIGELVKPSPGRRE